MIFLSPRRASPFLAWRDFHARSRFARSTIPEEKWATTRSLSGFWGGMKNDRWYLASNHTWNRFIRSPVSATQFFSSSFFFTTSVFSGTTFFFGTTSLKCKGKKAKKAPLLQFRLWLTSQKKHKIQRRFWHRRSGIIQKNSCKSIDNLNATWIL